MLPSGIKAYQTTDPVSLKQDAGVKGSRARPTGATTSPASVTDETGSPAKGDRVTLSSEVAMARLRDRLGLPPSGPVSRDQLEEARLASAARVNDSLAKKMTDVGIPTDSPLTLTQGADGRIRVEGGGQQARRLETALNKDETFKEAFDATTTLSRLDKWLQSRTGKNGLPLRDASPAPLVLSNAGRYAMTEDGLPFMEALAGVRQDPTPVGFTRP